MITRPGTQPGSVILEDDNGPREFFLIGVVWRHLGVCATPEEKQAIEAFLKKYQEFGKDS